MVKLIRILFINMGFLKKFIIGGIVKNLLVKLIMIFRIIILSSLLFVISSCRKCDGKLYFYKDYLYPNLDISLEINDKTVFKEITNKHHIPNIYKPSRYCKDLCTSNINDRLIKVRYSVQNQDTVIYLDPKKIQGIYLGYEISIKKINVILDSIGKGLYWDGLPTGFD
jgi:hypothetical protein